MAMSRKSFLKVLGLGFLSTGAGKGFIVPGGAAHQHSRVAAPPVAHPPREHYILSPRMTFQFRAKRPFTCYA